mgnify:CR=1 FL=1
MNLLLFIGIGVLAGYIVSRLAYRIHLPSVVGFIIAGLILGPSVLGLFTEEMVHRMDSLSHLALSMVAFIIGSELRWKEISRLGKKVFVILITESFGAFFFVLAGVWLVTGDLAQALIFAALAPATAPAGTVAVLQETRAKGPLTKTLLAIVGLDDGLAILLFAIATVLAKTILMRSSGLPLHIDYFESFFLPVKDIFGAILLGILMGILLSILLRKSRRTDQILILSMSFLMICTGLSVMFGFSLILANLTLGAYIANMYPRTSQRSLQGIQAYSPPIFVIFFVLAGAHLKIQMHLNLLMIIGAYLIMRIAGKFIGAWFGCVISKAPEVLKKNLGLALFSQAGVAVGLALIIQNEFREMGGVFPGIGILVINTIAATTLIFEILGPITTKIAVVRAGEENKLRKK